MKSPYLLMAPFSEQSFDPALMAHMQVFRLILNFQPKMFLNMSNLQTKTWIIDSLICFETYLIGEED